MNPHLKRWIVPVCVALLICCAMVLYVGRPAEIQLIPIGQLSGELPSQFETVTRREPLLPSGDADADAQFVLQAVQEQSQAVSSFRVRQTRRYTGDLNVNGTVRSLIVGTLPNQLVLRYENWAGALAFVSDGESFRVCNEHDLDQARPDNKKRYVSGPAPDSIDAFLRYAGQLSVSPPTHAFPELELMALLPFTENVVEFIASRGWGTINWIETVELDGRATEHLVCSGRVCRQKAEASSRKSNAATPTDSDDDLEPEEGKLHLWIDAEGPALLRKTSLGDFAMTYIDWAWNPRLPDQTYQLPATHGYQEIAFNFPEGGSWVGKQAPELALATLTGERSQLSDLRGEVIVLDFWATWCGPCMKELPIIDRIVDEFSGRGVMLLAVTNETDVDRIQAAIQKLNVTVEVAIDVDDNSSAFGVVAIPHLVVIDRQGDIQAVHIGLTSGLEETLRDELEQLAALP